MGRERKTQRKGKELIMAKKAKKVAKKKVVKKKTAKKKAANKKKRLVKDVIRT